MRRIMSAFSLLSLIAIGGCQSWSQVGQGFPNGSRVAPPGTGTFNVPSSYYNGPKGAGTAAGVSTTSAPVNGSQNRTVGFTQPATPNEVVPAGYQVPTVDQVRTGINNTAGAMLNDVSQRANQAVQNGTARAASAVQQYTSPTFGSAPPALTASGAASQSISDSPPDASNVSGPPKLDWQTPR